MCGRYGLLTDTQAIAEAFNAELGEGTEAFEARPSYNIAPQTFQPVIRLNEETGKRELMMMRWGLDLILLSIPGRFGRVR
jgi:putative SOS response-associated peptidase YedK